jgi:hypothetical protein
MASIGGGIASACPSRSYGSETFSGPTGWLQTRPAQIRRWPRRWQREYRLVMSRLDAHCLPQSEVNQPILGAETESAFDATPSPSTRAKAA